MRTQQRRWAAASGNGVEALRVLYSHDADFFVKSRTGMMLEAIAWKHKDIESFNFILEVKASVRKSKEQI